MPATASRTYNLRFNHCHGFTDVLYDLENSLRSYQYGCKNTCLWAAARIGGILPLDDSLHSCIAVPNRPLELTIRTAAISECCAARINARNYFFLVVSYLET